MWKEERKEGNESKLLTEPGLKPSTPYICELMAMGSTDISVIQMDSRERYGIIFSIFS